MKTFTTVLAFIFSFCCISTAVLADLPTPEHSEKIYTTVACNGFEYCESFASFADNEWIEGVEFGSISNFSGIDDGYADFTNFSTDVIPGNVYPITCTIGLTGNWTEFFRVWIDFNQNGLFEETELVFDPGESSESQSGNIAIPLDAVNGSTLMRVAMKFGSVSEACEAPFTFGEVEDYCVNVINPGFCYNPFVQVNDITDASALLDWNPVSIAQGYDLRYREVGTVVWTDLYLFEDSLALTGLDVCSSYEFQIRSDCDTTMTDYSDSYTFETIGCGPCIDFEYCQIGTTPSTFFSYIDAVTIGDLSNNSGDNGGYADFANQFPAILNNDSTYTLSLEAVFPYFVFEATWYAWIDYNGDGDFDEANELVFQSDPTLETLTETQITIPADAVIGLTKMRINVLQFPYGTQGACDEFFDGEQEDYCITIQPNVLPCSTPENLDTMDVTTFSAELLWDIDKYEIGVGYVVRYKPVTGSGWTELSTVIPSQPVYDLEECTEYEYQVRTVCPQELSDFSESFLFMTECFTSTFEEAFEPTEDIANISVYPNPFKDQINMELFLQKSGDINMGLYDMNGKLLLTQNHENLQVGAHVFNFSSTTPLAAGMYFLRVATENSVITKKLVRRQIYNRLNNKIGIA